MTKRIAILPALIAIALAMILAAAGGGSTASGASDPATRSAATKNGPIAFASGSWSEGNGIWAWKGGMPLRQITQNPTDSDPQGSPDGRWIVFTRGFGSQGEIFRAPTDGSQGAQLVISDGETPSFTRSGQRILFSRADPSHAILGQLVPEHIYSVKLDGTGLHQLTVGDVLRDRDPVFSPNGKIIAFDRESVANTRSIFTMRPDGSQVKKAKPSAPVFGVRNSEPAFSPNGKRIVFVRGFPGSSAADLFTMDPDGKNARRLTGRSGDPLGGVSSPSWSPDGTRIVFQRDEPSGSSKLWIIRVRDRKLLRTMGGPTFPQAPDPQMPTWLRD